WDHTRPSLEDQAPGHLPNGNDSRQAKHLTDRAGDLLLIEAIHVAQNVDGFRNGDRVQEQGMFALLRGEEERVGPLLLLQVSVREEGNQDVGIQEDFLHTSSVPIISRALRRSSTVFPGPTLNLPRRLTMSGVAEATRTWSPSTSQVRMSLGPTPSFSRTSLGTVV